MHRQTTDWHQYEAVQKAGHEDLEPITQQPQKATGNEDAAAQANQPPSATYPIRAV